MSLERFSLRDKVALVSGGSRGMGRAIALGLAEAGAKVMVAARGEEGLRGVREELQARGLVGATVQADVVDLASVDRMVAGTLDRFGRVDVLVNVAGTGLRKPVVEVEEAEYDRVMDTNLKGAYFASRAVAPTMMRQGSGKIVNIASATSFVGLSKVTVYAASKGGLLQMTRAMAAEWAPHNIQVNAVAPGFIRTDFNTTLWENRALYDWVVGNTPAGRLGTPDDVVGAALFLASDAASFITGQAIVVDGGFLAGGNWPL